MFNQRRHWPIWLACAAILLAGIAVEWLRGFLLLGVVLVCVMQLWPQKGGPA